MIYAKYNIIPPKEWQHNPLIHDKNGNTIAVLLAKNGTIPPK